MDSKQFQKILKKYRMGEATAEEEALVNLWYDSLDEETSHQHIPEEEWQRKGNRIWEALNSKIGPPVFKKLHSHRQKWGWGIAVMATLLVCFGFWWFNSENIQPNAIALIENEAQGIAIVTRVNATIDTMRVVLHDGTQIILDPGSSLKYPVEFGSSKREVVLIGAAFFDVTRMEKVPFYVYANAVVTKVLGTSFRIVASITNEVEVSVRTGKVSLYENTTLINNLNTSKSANIIIVNPNQKVLYKPLERTFNTTLVERPLPLIRETSSSETEVSFLFEEAPLSKVLNSLTIAYGVNIEVEDVAILTCPFTGDLFGDNLFKQLDIICKVLNMTYEIRDLKVLIKGQGCNH